VRVADYIARFLERQGVTDVFMLSGTGSIYLDDALLLNGTLRYTCARHEAAAVVMAEASARMKCGLGCAVVTTGPGGVNAIGGLVEAWVDSCPVLVISGQVERRHYVAGTRAFGVQGFDIVEIARGMTKYASRVTVPERIRYHLERAAHLATSGRPGPVWLDIPTDVQRAVIDPEGLEGFEPDHADARPAIAASSLDADLEAIVGSLQASRRPLIILGQGVRQAQAVDSFLRLLEVTGAPFVSSRLALDVVSFAHPQHMGLGGIRGRRHVMRLMRQCDFALSLGASLSPAFVGENFDAFAPGTTVVMVDLDPAETSKAGVPVARRVHHDVKSVIEGLLSRIPRDGSPKPRAWLEHCQAEKQCHPTVIDLYRGDPINSYHFIERLEDHSGPGDVFVSDAGGSYYCTGQVLRFERRQRELTSGTFASMGVALPLAIGAAATDRNARILVVTGDGSIELHIQELKTVSQAQLTIKVFVINNGGYASIRDSQDAACGGRYTDHCEPLDFRKVAAAFGLSYHLLQREEELDAHLPAILAEPGPALIEVACDRAQEMIRPLDWTAIHDGEEPQ